MTRPVASFIKYTPGRVGTSCSLSSKLGGCAEVTMGSLRPQDGLDSRPCPRSSALSISYGPEALSRPLQRLLQLERIPPVADAHVAIHLEVIARHDEHVMLLTQPCGQLGRVDGRRVVHKGDGPSLGRDAVHQPLLTVDPARHDLEVLAENHPRARHQALVSLRSQRDAR